MQVEAGEDKASAMTNNRCKARAFFFFFFKKKVIDLDSSLKKVAMMMVFFPRGIMGPM